MKKIVAIGVLSLILAACAGTASLLTPASAPALQGITGIDALMGAPCNTNWSRIAPHVCGRTVAGTGTLLVNDNTCRSLDLNAAYGVSTNSQFAIIESWNALTVLPRFYSDNTCTNIFVTGTTSSYTYIPVRLINGVLWYKNGSGGVAPNINPMVYYD